MPTVYRQAFEAAYEEARTPDLDVVLADYLRKMRTAYFLDQDWFGQQYMASPDLVDAFCFARLHSRLHDGQILVCQIELGRAPYPDRDLPRNQELLKELPTPFRAQVWGGLADFDGYLFCDAPVQVMAVGPHSQGMIARLEGNSRIPLEIGYTGFERTFFHLWESGCLARWPYGHEQITILVDPERCIWCSWLEEDRLYQ